MNKRIFFYLEGTFYEYEGKGKILGATVQEEGHTDRILGQMITLKKCFRLSTC